jgi:hypothetical protein
MKHLFIVKNISSGEVNSPSTYRKDGTLNGATYSLIKKDSTVFPTGEYVCQLSENEFKGAYSLPIITPSFTGIREYKRLDKEFCSELILEFESDTGALTMEDTNTLLALLGGVLQFLQINSPHNARVLLDTVTVSPLFPQPAKDKYLAKLDNHLNKFPR